MNKKEQELIDNIKKDVHNPINQALGYLKKYNRDSAQDCIMIAEKNSTLYINDFDELDYSHFIKDPINVIKEIFEKYPRIQAEEIDSLYESLIDRKSYVYDLRDFKQHQIPQIVNNLGEKISEIIDSTSKLISEEFQDNEHASEKVIQETEDYIKTVINSKINSVLERRAITNMHSTHIFNALDIYMENLTTAAKISKEEDISGYKERLVVKTKELMNILVKGADKDIAEYLNENSL